jgi:hypothetical protein
MKLLAKKWFLIKVLGGQVGPDVIVAVCIYNSAT